MNPSYTERDVELLGSVLHKLMVVNRIEDAVIPKDLDQNSIIEIATSTEERLFLLGKLIDDVIASKPILDGQTATCTFNANAIHLIEAIKRILGQKDRDYIVKILDIPGLEVRSSNLFEAKWIANVLQFDTNVIYRDQVIFSKA